MAFVAGACGAWALDNAMSQRLAVRDPVAVARAKTLAAGGINLALGLALHELVPSPVRVGAALLTGSIGYGLSIVLHLLAVRSVGAARQAAFFGTAPFIDALIALPLLRERLPLTHLAAGALMAVGVAVVVRSRHAHAHAHDSVEHEHEHAHAHAHDEHHRHDHPTAAVEPHSHVHTHAPLVHDHPHAPETSTTGTPLTRSAGD